MSKTRKPNARQVSPSSEGWELQAAKVQFSQVFRRARERTPQVVTKQGKEAVVILALGEFERLTKRDKPPKSLSQFFTESPLARVSLDLKRKPIG